jgi:hypothetical protein
LLYEYLPDEEMDKVTTYEETEKLLDYFSPAWKE